MHEVHSQSFGMDTDYSALYGSDMTGGSSGGPSIEDFGIANSVGQLRANPNMVVGVTSYGPSGEFKVQGSSILNQEFLDILAMACKHRAGNCAE